MLGGSSPDVRARLPHFAPAELWGRHSSKHIVRDLYAGYAADPLAPGPRKATIGSASSSNVGTPRNDSKVPSPSSRPGFLERYVRQQAHIEKLLNEWQPPDLQSKACSEGKLDDAEVKQKVSVLDANGVPLQAVNIFSLADDAVPSHPLHVVARTRNVSFEGGVMTCSSKSGGARLSPPEELSFRLCVRPLDPLETHPIYIGMVPAGVSGSEVNFLNDRKEGIFLRIGGYPPGREAIDGPPLDDADPLRPEFQVFGERMPAALSMPRPDHGVALHLYESFPRHVSITEKIQCKGCKKLLASPELFAEHCFDACGRDDHGDDFGFDSCRRVELMEDGEYNFDQSLSTTMVRFQVENRRDSGMQEEASTAVPQAKSLRNGVPSLPRELPELVGGRAAFGPLGPWQPCILLCKPGTRVQVSWLPAGMPESSPKPPRIRPAAGGGKVTTQLS